MVEEKLSNMSEANAKDVILKGVVTLCNDYEIVKDAGQIKYICERVYSLIKYKFTQMQVFHFERAIIEVTSNYPTYRTINVAVIVTAIYRVYHDKRN